MAELTNGIMILCGHLFGLRIPSSLHFSKTDLTKCSEEPFDTAPIPTQVRAFFNDLKSVGGCNKAARDAKMVVTIDAGDGQEKVFFLWNPETEMPAAVMIGENEDAETFVFDPRDDGRWVMVWFRKEPANADR